MKCMFLGASVQRLLMYILLVLLIMGAGFATYQVSSAPPIEDVATSSELANSIDIDTLTSLLQEHEVDEESFDSENTSVGATLLAGPGVSEMESGIEIVDAPTPAPTNKTEFEKWAYDNAPILHFTRQDGTVVDIHACETENIITATIFGVSTRVHKEALPYLRDVESAWQARGGNSFYKIPGSIADGYAMGGYSCRHVRGSTTAISNHSYGVAFDVNPTTNPYVIFVNSLTSVAGIARTIDSIATLYNPPTLYVAYDDKQDFVSERDHYTDMPDDFVDIWKYAGWGWGGNFNSNRDAMHFSLVTAEFGTVARFGNSSSGAGFILLLPDVDTNTSSDTNTNTSTDTYTGSGDSGGGRPWDNDEKPGNGNGGNPHNSDSGDDGVASDPPSGSGNGNGNGNNNGQLNNPHNSTTTNGGTPPGNSGGHGNGNGRGRPW